MIDKIGTSAGQVWECLNENGDGALSLTGLATKTKLERAQVDMAVGWLAREGKVVITQRGDKKKVTEVTLACD